MKCQVFGCPNNATVCKPVNNPFLNLVEQKNTRKSRLAAIKSKKPLCKQIKELSSSQTLFQICKYHDQVALEIKKTKNNPQQLVEKSHSKFVQNLISKLLRTFFVGVAARIFLDQTSVDKTSAHVFETYVVENARIKSIVTAIVWRSFTFYSIRLIKNLRPPKRINPKEFIGLFESYQCKKCNQAIHKIFK